jgi:GT2 family glycosyltransferase
MIEISIVIVNWNSKQYIRKCLDSIRLTTFKEAVEIIIVDNGSTDGSTDEIEKYFPEVRLIKNKSNMGFARANNIGIRVSRGNIVCLINSDVKVLDNSIWKMYSYLVEHSNVGIIGPRVLNPDLSLQNSILKLPSISNSLVRAFGADSIMKRAKKQSDEVRSVGSLAGCFLMVKKAAIDDVGLLDEQFFFYAEDIDWCKRFIDANWEVLYFPEAKIIHYGGGSSAVSPIKYYVEMHKANLRYWKKHHNRAEQLLYISIVILHQIIRILRSCTLYIVRPGNRAVSLHKIKRSLKCLEWMLHINSAVLFKS